MDIKNELPEQKGFSSRNIKLMVMFYREYKDIFEIVQPAVAQNDASDTARLILEIPWTHNVVLIQKIKDRDLRIWYMHKIIENGWSKNVLSMMIQSSIHNREGATTSNFKQMLPKNDSDLVQQSFKDPYIFDFLTISKPFKERELLAVRVIY